MHFNTPIISALPRFEYIIEVIYFFSNKSTCMCACSLYVDKNKVTSFLSVAVYRFTSLGVEDRGLEY